MTGPIGLHGGGEFLAGDEPFLTALLEVALRRTGGDRPVRVAMVPTAAARSRPELAAANGVRAFERVAASRGIEVVAGSVPIDDIAGASDRGLAARLAAADVIHFPGGDPDLIPSILGGSLAWAAIRDARRAGAVVAGASAGAMALATWCWTPAGGVPGLRLVGGLVVVPHAERAGWDAARKRSGFGSPTGLGFLGLAERTAVLTGGTGGSGEIGSTDDATRPTEGRWRVFGPGVVLWRPEAAAADVVAMAGEMLVAGVVDPD